MARKDSAAGSHVFDAGTLVLTTPASASGIMQTVSDTTITTPVVDNLNDRYFFFVSFGNASTAAESSTRPRA